MVECKLLLMMGFCSNLTEDTVVLDSGHCPRWAVNQRLTCSREAAVLHDDAVDFYFRPFVLREVSSLFSLIHKMIYMYYRFPSSTCVGIGQVSLPERVLSLFDDNFLLTQTCCDLPCLPASITLQMLATVIVLRTGKMLGVISFPDMDLSIPRKVSYKINYEVGSSYRSKLHSGFNTLFMFPDVPAATALCRESDIRTVWDTETQVRAYYLSINWHVI